MGVDGEGFDAAMAAQNAEARKAWAGSGEAATDALWFSLREELGPTEFLGYDTESAEGSITAIVKDGMPHRARPRGETVRIITNQTPFYGEGGGQVGDVGAIFSGKGAEGEVIDTEKKLGNLHVHVVKISRGEFAHRRCGRAARRFRARAAPRAPITRRRICCMPRSSTCSARMSRRRARWSGPTACASTSRIPRR